MKVLHMGNFHRIVPLVLRITINIIYKNLSKLEQSIQELHNHNFLIAKIIQEPGKCL